MIRLVYRSLITLSAYDDKVPTTIRAPVLTIGANNSACSANTACF